ncbi:ABC transporter ATP-binding protein [Kribbella jejuensis]|uniref:Iron complex transport system ATP-binding protein n=1 Tax=Kribbella jejuensis TaxID=236068 RepID=A0A542DUB3_9ACTN|nr:ABC transporter ATP-binding protein [Kribbella jejuensis]TQJ06702.1 iron complex transport system ATP-binding protein [Kribbella jejuensis]
MRLVVRDVGVVVDRLPILSGIDLTVEPGQFVGIIGPNGAGKSTLLRAVYRALRPTTGTVLLGDDDVWRTPAKTIAKRRAVVTQHQTMATDFTVEEMVSMGRTPHKGLLDRDNRTDRAVITDALSAVDLAAAGGRLFSTLSGGERQRVLLARALAQQAPLIVLDEPTNHLDVRAQLELLQLVRSLGITTIAALHDLDQAAAHADRLAVLQSGHLIAEGPPLVVLTVPLIESVFGVRAHISPHPLHGRPHIALAPLP